MKHFFLLFSSLLLILSACDEEGQAEIASKYPDGTTQKIHFVKWDKNTKHVVKEMRFYPNGEKELEGGLKNWKREGKWTYWYSNRQIKLEENYVDGKKEGKIIEYYKSGEINYTGEFLSDHPNGDWIFYDGNGNITSTVTYENGQLKK